MAEPDKADSPPPPELEIDERFGHQLAMMWGAFVASPVRNQIIGIVVAIVAVILLIAVGQVVLNRWYQPFYDAISRRDIPGFLYQLELFAAIAGTILIFNIAQTWLNQMLHIKLRQGLVLDLLGEWLKPRRAFRLSRSGTIGINPDQRLHEDARHLTDLSTDLGVGLVQSTILLVSFVGVLWSLSAGFVFHVGGRSFAIPGYMVWAAIVYAGLASILSWLVGRPLIRLNSERYAREAELRFSLMRVNDQIDAISLVSGEGDEKRRLVLDLDSVLEATRAIVRATVRLSWVTSGYGWITVVAPIVIASPVYFAGDLTFGGLMMAVGAFTQVHAALRWFVDNIGGIADWRATLLRVAAFRAALISSDGMALDARHIEIGDVEEPHMVFDDVVVRAADYSLRLAERHVEIAEGERVLIVGPTGQDKTLFFRAIAGLWPLGSGRIGRPRGEAIAFMPRAPYLPPGSLRAVLSYPNGPDAFADAQVEAALDAACLPRLKAALDRVTRWDRELNDDEKELVALARLVLQQPRWIVMDEVAETGRNGISGSIFPIIARELGKAAVIGIGPEGEGDGFFTRTLRLEVERLAPPSRPPRRSRRKGRTAAAV